ncbi:copper amine oxidase-like domain-containing protein [Mycoplasma sp. CAG:956]|nr:copper amine oxidase-like domain-containing protein [Mycoplasma sp. CAG:956]
MKKSKTKSKNKKRRRKLKKWPKLVLLLMILAALLFILKKSLDNYNITFTNTYEYLIEKINNQKKNHDEKKQQENNQKLEADYNNCLEQKYSEEEKSEKIIKLENELNDYLKNYSLSVKFVDINSNYTFSYNESKVYYAASTIKMLDAIYIYENALEGNIDLDTTKKYTKNFKVLYSAGLEKHKIGDMISLRDLVKYAITVSDNSAHQMLVDYIGFTNLKKYGNSLGAKNTLIGGDNFGQIDTNDSIAYLTELYKFINDNSALSKELKSYFIESDENFLKDEENEIEAATKYGEYGNTFHNNGIVYTKNPYLISILTNLGKKKGASVIKSVNNKIQELQEVVYENHINYCQQKIYSVQND